jgi:hypothetical protein
MYNLAIKTKLKIVRIINTIEIAFTETPAGKFSTNAFTLS